MKQSVFERWLSRNTLWWICCPGWVPVWTGGSVVAKWTRRKWLHNDQHIITLHMSKPPHVQGQYSLVLLPLSVLFNKALFTPTEGIYSVCAVSIEMFWSTDKDLTFLLVKSCLMWLCFFKLWNDVMDVIWMQQNAVRTVYEFVGQRGKESLRWEKTLGRL